MHLRDYLLTDNGAFVEVVRASAASGSRIIGLAHLDSARCTRTADPDVPILYRDRLGKIHEMRWWQVLTFLPICPTRARPGMAWACARPAGRF